MSDQDVSIKIEGMTEVLNELSFLESSKVNDEYLKPAMRSIGGTIKKAEKTHIGSFTGKTKKSLTSKITTNGIGSVTLTVGPSSKRRYIFRFIEQGAQWHDRSSGKTTWRGREKARDTRASKVISLGGKPNSSYLPARALIGWVIQKLGASPGADSIHTAFRVAKTIGRNGLQAKPIVPPTVVQIKEAVIAKFNETMRRMVEELHNHAK